MENWTRLLAGDEECYDLVGDLIDPAICVVHNVDQINSLRSEINLNWKEIQGGKFYGGRLGALLWTKHYLKYTRIQYDSWMFNSRVIRC